MPPQGARYLGMIKESVARLLAASIVLAAPLAAQKQVAPSFSVKESVLTGGGAASLRYHNPALAGQAVLIEVDNGMRNGTQKVVIEIQLDANGVGTKVWQVPTWIGANFNAPGVAEVHRVVM